jgi:hypothetical protein
MNTNFSREAAMVGAVDYLSIGPTFFSCGANRAEVRYLQL